MQLTHRSQGLVALVIVLAILGVTFARPVLLAGGVLIGAWILGAQTQFLATLTRLTEGLVVRQWPERSSLRHGEQTNVRLAVRQEVAVPLSLNIEAGVPTAAVPNRPVTLELEPHEREATHTVSVSWPVTGRHQFEDATVTATDGLFVETVTTGQLPTVTVEPRGPRHIHVGEGGDRFAIASGEHRTGRLGAGLEPAELREYVPGETVSRIDWKATARLAKPYVREYEAESHRRTLFVVDHRSALSMGPPDETKLDYLRDVALAVASSAHQLSDPLGLITVGDRGVTERGSVSASADRYPLIRRRLLELEPTAPGDGPLIQQTRSTRRRTQAWLGRSTTPTDRHQLLGEPSEGDSAFVASLEPFYTAQQRYREPIEEQPLYRALRRELAAETGQLWVVIFTDDSNLEELYEAVTAARSQGHDVLVALTPTVLFEPSGVDQVEHVYDRYHAFEEDRRTFARMHRVTALEVAPRDRLSAVLARGRTKRASQ